MMRFFLVEQRITLPLLVPTDQEMSALSEGRPTACPSRGFLGRPAATTPLEIDWVLINLDDEEHRVLLRFNGINEFHEYSPGVQEGEEQVIPRSFSMGA